MKALTLGALAAAVCFLSPGALHGQYKGARDYFPKSYPAPSPGGGSRSVTNTPAKLQPAKTAPSKFKDIPVNTGFYFLSDTNRTYLWTKSSVSQAKNSKNGVVQTISAETPVQK